MNLKFEVVLLSEHKNKKNKNKKIKIWSRYLKQVTKTITAQMYSYGCLSHFKSNG